MKKLTIGLVIIAVLVMTAPLRALSLGAGGQGNGQLTATGRGGAGRLNRGGGARNINPVGPFNHVDPFDREGAFDHGAMRGNRRRERFAFPTCFAYAYCPSPVWPCQWQEGYWTAQPSVDEYGYETLIYAWIPAGCY